jgi:hypothetical protein
MWLLNDLTPAEREADDLAKRVCPTCAQRDRRLLVRRVSDVVWNSDVPTHFPPRRVVNARIQVFEETWWCPPCAEDGRVTVGTTLSFRHLGDPSELVPVDELPVLSRPLEEDAVAGEDGPLFPAVLFPAGEPPTRSRRTRRRVMRATESRAASHMTGEARP